MWVFCCILISVEREIFVLKLKYLVIRKLVVLFLGLFYFLVRFVIGVKVFIIGNFVSIFYCLKNFFFYFFDEIFFYILV